VTQHPHLRRSSRGPRDLGGGRIVATVIYEDDLIIDQTVEHGANLADECRDIFGFVSDRDNDRKVHLAGALTPFDSSDKSTILFLFSPKERIDIPEFART